MKYLNGSIRTLEELKKAYHRLCLKLHPDVGGSDDEMKILNAEYERLFEQVKNIHVNKVGETYERETDETPEAFQELIAELLKMDGIEIEIIGCFVWVSGNTKPHKEQLKALGLNGIVKNCVGTNRRRVTDDGEKVNTPWMRSAACIPA